MSSPTATAAKPEFLPPGPNRRTFFGNLAGVAAIAASGAAQGTAPISPQPDAELIAACAQFDALVKKAEGLFSGPNAIECDDERMAVLELIDLDQDVLLDRMGAVRAATPQGIVARFNSMLAFGFNTDVADMLQSSSPGDRLLGCFIRDFAEIHGLAVSFV